MLLQHRRTFATLIRAFDLATLWSASYAAHVAAIDTAETRPWHLAVEWLTIAVVWTWLARCFSIYQSRRSTSLWTDLAAVAQVLVLTTAVAWLVRTLIAPGSRATLAPQLGVAFAAALLARLVLRLSLAALRRSGRNTRSYLFLGRGKALHAIAAEIAQHPSYGIRIVGGLAFTGEEAQPLVPGVKPLGTTAALEPFLRAASVDEIVVCPADGVWPTEVKSILQFCQAVGVECRVVPDFLGIPLANTVVAPIGKIPAYLVHTGIASESLLVLKRLVDIAGSLAGIVLLLPLLLAIAVAIKLTSPGPVLFRQRRVGLGGTEFTMLKFRSMYRDAERRRAELLARNEQQGPVFKIKDDPRITPLGRLLRRYSLDELPQLGNVLLGDMSIVGPRPPLMSEVRQYDWWQRRRLAVRPGLTCLWQVSGRNAIGFERWMELDLQYIDGWSLALDLKIMSKTFGEVFRGGGV